MMTSPATYACELLPAFAMLFLASQTRFHLYVTACVCVCERERERESGWGGEGGGGGAKTVSVCVKSLIGLGGAPLPVRAK